MESRSQSVKMMVTGTTAVLLLFLLASLKSGSPSTPTIQTKTAVAHETTERIQASTDYCEKMLKTAARQHDGSVWTAARYFKVNPRGVFAYYDDKQVNRKLPLTMADVAKAGVLGRLSHVLRELKQQHRSMVQKDAVIYLTKDNSVVTADIHSCTITGVYLPQPDKSINEFIASILTTTNKLIHHVKQPAQNSATASTMAANGSTRDVIIVGAGVAGLFINWKLHTHESTQNLSVLQLERLNRIGGRFFSSRVKIEDTGEEFQIENGGMRFYPDYHLRLHRLFKVLGLCSNITQFSGPPGAEDVFFLRGSHLSKTESETVFRDYLNGLYNLDPWEQVFPNNLTEQLFNNISASGSACSPPQTGEEWMEFGAHCSHDGLSMHEWGFSTLIDNLGLSDEGFSLEADLGFNSWYGGIENAMSGFQRTVNNHANPTDIREEFSLAGGGMGLIPLGLNDLLTAVGRGAQLNSAVTSIEFDEDSQMYRVIASVEGNVVEYYGRKVVLALGREQLEDLASTSPILRKSMDLIQSVSQVPLTKINLIWKNMWWTPGEDGLAGSSTASDELDSVYANHLWHSTNSGALTIYCSHDSVNFWNNAHRDGSEEFQWDGVIVESIDEKEGLNLRASQTMVDSAMRKLRLLFSSEIPYPDAATYSPWGTNITYGASVHSWRVPTNSLNVIAAMWNLDESGGEPGGISVANEAYSAVQGWVEGSLFSAEKVLDKVFGIPPDAPIASGDRCDFAETLFSRYYRSPLP